MEIAPVARFAVPAGTAAATVVAHEATGDETTDGRRFSVIAALDDARFRGSFEELIVAGVYTVLANRVLVLRITADGVRSLAALVAIGSASPACPLPRAGLDVVVHTHALDVHAPKTAELRCLLERETKQRPVFHGMTPGGVTYSGFEAQATTELLAAIAAALDPCVRATALNLVFAGPTAEVPAGLVVGIRQASV